MNRNYYGGNFGLTIITNNAFTGEQYEEAEALHQEVQKGKDRRDKKGNLGELGDGNF